MEEPYIKQRILEKDINLEGALEAATILKRTKTDANCYETEKNQASVAMANTIELKCDLDPETTVDNGSHVDHIAAVFRTSKANNIKLVKCQNCGLQHPMRKCLAFGKACFSCGKLGHYAEFCRKTRQATLNSLLDALKNSSSVLRNANALKPSLINITMNGVHLSGLFYTSARDCFMTTKLAKRLG